MKGHGKPDVGASVAYWRNYAGARAATRVARVVARWKRAVSMRVAIGGMIAMIFVQLVVLLMVTNIDLFNCGECEYSNVRSRVEYMSTQPLRIDSKLVLRNPESGTMETKVPCSWYTWDKQGSPFFPRGPQIGADVSHHPTMNAKLKSFLEYTEGECTPPPARSRSSLCALFGQKEKAAPTKTSATKICLGDGTGLAAIVGGDWSHDDDLDFDYCNKLDKVEYDGYMNVCLCQYGGRMGLCRNDGFDWTRDYIGESWWIPLPKTKNLGNDLSGGQWHLRHFRGTHIEKFKTMDELYSKYKYKFHSWEGKDTSPRPTLKELLARPESRLTKSEDGTLVHRVSLGRTYPADGLSFNPNWTFNSVLKGAASLLRGSAVPRIKQRSTGWQQWRDNAIDDISNWDSNDDGRIDLREVLLQGLLLKKLVPGWVTSIDTCTLLNGVRHLDWELQFLRRVQQEYTDARKKLGPGYHCRSEAGPCLVDPVIDYMRELAGGYVNRNTKGCKYLCSPWDTEGLPNLDKPYREADDKRKCDEMAKPDVEWVLREYTQS